MQARNVWGRFTSTSYPTRMLLVCSLGWATIQCGRFVIPPLVPEIEATLGMSSAGIGISLTAFSMIYALTQYPAGSYSDALTRATLIVPGFVALVASFALLGLATTVVLFVAGLVVMGLGKGLYTPPTRALMGDLFEARRGRALGIYSAGTDLGGLVGSGLAVVVIAVATWRTAFVPLVVLLALVTVLFAVWNRQGYRFERVELEAGATLGRLLATPAQRNLLIAYSVFFFVVGGITNFLPALIVSQGRSPTFASATFALLFAVGLVIKPAAGELSDRFPRLGVSVGMLLVCAVGIVLLLLIDSMVAVAGGTILMAAGYKTQFPITDAVIMEAAPSENMGGDLGAARAAFLGASALGPGFVGIVADLASYTLAFWVLSVGLLVSAGLLVLEEVRG